MERNITYIACKTGQQAEMYTGSAEKEYGKQILTGNINVHPCMYYSVISCLIVRGKNFERASRENLDPQV